MSPRYETSSWGVVYRIRNGEIEVLLIERKSHGNSTEYVLPKGHIEWNEKAKDTALREISEETGLHVKDLEIIKFMTKVNYTFTALHLEGQPVVNKDVYLFLVRYTWQAQPRLEKTKTGEGRFFIGIRWFSLAELATISLKPDILSFVEKNKPYLF